MSEYYIEYYPVGNSMKVSAVDPITQKEVCILGPIDADKQDLKTLAVKKLEKAIKHNT